jgi:hypothetical protein
VICAETIACRERHRASILLRNDSDFTEARYFVGTSRFSFVEPVNVT